MGSMPGFRMGGSGGWDVRGTANARADKSKAKGQVMFNDQELTAFLIDLKTEYPREFKALLKEAVNDTAHFLQKKGERMRREFRNEVYSAIGNSIDVKEIKAGGHHGYRIYAAPEGSGPKGSRDVNLVGLVQDKIPPWNYGFKVMGIKGKYPVESSEVYGSQTGKWASPILLKGDKPLQFPGIGTSSFPTWDFTADIKKSAETDIEFRVREWLKAKFNVAQTGRYRVGAK
tara:strand:- start:32977 stop:33666 length:690 start_codon:yes stop_codon:yes gene_type:complete